MGSVDAPVGEAAGNGPRDSSQPFLYKATCIGSMEVALLFQYLIIMNLFSGMLVFLSFFKSDSNDSFTQSVSCSAETVWGHSAKFSTECNN